MSKKTAQTIVESGNEYVLQVKGNQKNLLRSINKTIRNSTPIDSDYTLEQNKDRIENREAHLYEVPLDAVLNDWYGLKHIVHIKSYGKRGSRQYSENRYYITSKKEIKASEYNAGIRDHWGIENKLHWVKDKILNEDSSMITNLKTSENMSVIRNTIMNLFRLNGHTSIKYAIERFSNRLDKSVNLICNNIISV